MLTLSLRLFCTTLLASTLAACVAQQPTTTAHTVDVTAANANVQLGIAFLQKDNTQAAKQKFLTALAEAPDQPAPWYGMGYYYEATGQLTPAKTYYQKAVSLAPGDGNSQNNYGTFLCRHGQYKEAIKHFKLAMSDQGYLQTSGALENAGVCALAIPDKVAAKHFFEQALTNNPNLQTSLIELAKLAADDKQASLANNCLQRYLSLHRPTMRSHQLAIQLNTHKDARHARISRTAKVLEERFNDMQT